MRIKELTDKYSFTFDDSTAKLSLDNIVLTASDLLELVNQNYPFLHRNNEAHLIAEGIKSSVKLKQTQDIYQA